MLLLLSQRTYAVQSRITNEQRAIDHMAHAHMRNTHKCGTRTHRMFHLIYMQTIRFDWRRSDWTRLVYVQVSIVCA